MPAEWCDEWMPEVARAAHMDKVLIKRGVWRGTQYYTTLRSIPHDETTDGGTKVEHGGFNVSAEHHVLVISRSVPTSEEEEFLASVRAAGEFELIGAEAVYLEGASVPLDILSPRELEVLALLGLGMSVEETAKALHRSPDTVKTHRRSISEKLGTSDRHTLSRIANRAGLRVDDVQLKKCVSTGCARPHPAG